MFQSIVVRYGCVLRNSPKNAENSVLDYLRDRSRIPDELNAIDDCLK